MLTTGGIVYRQVNGMPDALKYYKAVSYTHLDVYKRQKIGYVPCYKDNESVAKALEDAYDDWCISLLAEALGDGPNREKYAAFAKGYQVYFDASTRFMRGLDSEGNWRTPFNRKPASLLKHYGRFLSGTQPVL